jgi:hypothetical protein
MATSPRGFIVDRGLSPIDQQPYVAIMVLKSKNVKTGDMVQVFIIRPDVSPLEAIASGDDYTICGGCPHRRKWNEALGKFTRSCYVDVGKSVGAVYRAFARGSYPVYDPSLHARYVRGRRIRWGAYGDPAILAESVVRDLNALASGHTGYTHQWRQAWAEWCRGLFQASCDGMTDYLDAAGAGWKTFAVIPQAAVPYSGKLCPATAEGSNAQCVTCRLCDGAKTDIFVEAHGIGAAYVGG